MSRPPDLVVHRDRIDAADLEPVNGTLTTRAARTAIDLARSCNRLDALALLDNAIRHRVRTAGRAGTNRSELRDEVQRHSGRPRFRQAAELVEYANGLAESPMESRTRVRCIDAGLPEPEPQIEIWVEGVLRRIDLGWRERTIGLDYESGTWHPD